MLEKRFKFLGRLLAAVVILPLASVFAYFSYLYLTSAFPSRSLAAERFAHSGIYELPKQATDLYFRMAMPSPMDQGGAAMRFTTSEEELARMLSAVPPGLEWRLLESEFRCECLQCIRYSEPVEIPAGSSRLYAWRARAEMAQSKGQADQEMAAKLARLKRKRVEMEQEISILKKTSTYTARNLT